MARAKNVPRKPKVNKSGTTIQKVDRALTIAGKALSIGVGVAKVLNVEKKYVDVDYNVTGFDSGVYTMQLLNGLAQGDGGSQRDGDQAKFLSLQWKGHIQNTTSASTLSYRFIIFQDRQADGTAPTIAELLELAGSGKVAYSSIRMDNKMRFRILHDDFFHLDPVNNDRRTLQGYMHLGKNGAGLKTRYGGATAAVADLNSNSLYCVAISSEATGAQSKADIQFRLRYVDN